MSKVVIGCVLAALAIQVWAILYWAVSPLPFRFMRPLPDEVRVVALLSEKITENGMYRFPFPADDTEQATDAFVARHKAGPIGSVFLRTQGSDPMSPMTIVKGVLHNIASSGLVAAVLILASPALPTYRRRVLLVFLVGAFAAFAIGLSNPIWLQHPWGFAIFNAVYIATAWLIAGLVLARFVRPKLA